MIRSTTDEMLAARFDPEPYVTEDGKRQATSEVPYRLGGRTYADYAPRVECIPSRDPEPFISTLGARTSMALEGDKFWRWSPRPEYARPEPNPILVAFRQATIAKGLQAFTARHAAIFLADLDANTHGWAVSQLPEHIEDARKVLTRLVGVFG